MNKKTSRQQEHTVPEYEANSVNLLRRDFALLRAVAACRSDAVGGRRSVSAVLQRLVEQHRKEFEAEVRKGLNL